jgi:galactose mutarotase-like enzyme
MEHQIENNKLVIKIKSKGAELFSIYNKQTQLEYMWGADPKFWAKSSPVLFPIVGALKDNTYIYKNKRYSLPRHGFARDEEFKAENQQKDSITFLLTSSASSKEKYPFDFELRISYRLKDHSLYTHYEVKNSGNEEMYFSLGAHPAFNAPLAEGMKYDDYYIEFDQNETIGRWPITKDGLISGSSTPLLNNSNRVDLTRELFANDALVFKQTKSSVVSLKTDKDQHGLKFSFPGFPFLGLWTSPGADFVCIEPWCGIADSVNHNQELTAKGGIERLAANESWSRTWSVDLY